MSWRQLEVLNYKGMYGQDFFDKKTKGQFTRSTKESDFAAKCDLKIEFWREKIICS